MTKEEVLAKLKELGIDVNGATDEVIQKAQAWLEDQKAQLDTETRRKVRAAWIAISVVALVVGLAVGWIKIGAVLGVIWGATLESVAPLVYWYLAFMAADLLTGIWAACRTGTFSSKRLSFGMAKKGLAFFIITLAHGIDVSFWFVLHDMPLFQSVTLCAYACGEFGSIVENIERAGFGDALPPVLKKLFLSLEKRLENAVDSKLDQIGLDDEEKDKKTK